MGGLLASALGRAEPLSIEPLVGLALQYSSNPFLTSGGRSEHDEAILVDAPLHYDLDHAHYSFDPAVRYSDSGSYASLNSNYFHLSGTASYLTDLDTWTLKAGAARDSSLYHYGLSSGGIGVRADNLSAEGTWQRILTPVSSVAVDAGWSRAFYNQGAVQTGLVNYRYLAMAGTFNYSLSERDTLSFSGNGGEYQAINGLTSSRNFGVKLGFDRQLTELWKLSLSTGYAKSDNSESLYLGPFLIGGVIYGPFYVGTAKAVQRGPVFGASLTRQSETFTVKSEVSRSFLPNGFAFLSRQDIAEVNLTYHASERWTYSAIFSYQDTATPQFSGALFSTHYYSGQLSADFHLTPLWKLSAGARWVKVKYQLPPIGADSTSISLEISRQFLRTDL
jgi:hypothetical protein